VTVQVLMDKKQQPSTVDVRYFRAGDCDTDHYPVDAKVRQRQSVSKRGAQKFDTAKFNLKKLNDVAVKQYYQVKFSSRFVASENLNDDDDDDDDDGHQ
jgi:hypothetical protein